MRARVATPHTPPLPRPAHRLLRQRHHGIPRCSLVTQNFMNHQVCSQQQLTQGRSGAAVRGLQLRTGTQVRVTQCARKGMQLGQALHWELRKRALRGLRLLVGGPTLTRVATLGGTCSPEPIAYPETLYPLSYISERST